MRVELSVRYNDSLITNPHDTSTTIFLYFWVAETLLFGQLKIYLIYDKNDSDIESL